MNELEANTIYCGDNLEILSKLPTDSIDLIYADPPFFSNRHYEVIWKDGAELRAFDDRWKGGIEHYIGWMEHRLRECHRVLKPTGSMYLHCDWHANAYLRVSLDKIFGINQFKSEIIWYRYNKIPDKTKKLYFKMHDNILFYTKGAEYCFNPELINTGEQITRKKMKKIAGKICNTSEYITYEKQILKTRSVFDDIPDIAMGNSKEKIGYPTQKPLSLLKRLINASSNKGDIVLDPFCGCGTAISVAYQLGRKYIGIDVSPTACEMMKRRLTKIGANPLMVNMPTIMENVKTLNPFEFQNWVINKIQATPQKTKSNDMGIDGWTYMLHEPIQIKQSSNIGRNVVDNFETAMRRANATKGFIYALSFGKGAYEEVARAKSDNIEITLIKVESLLS